MGEVDRIHRIVQPAGVPAPANQAIRAEDRHEDRREPPEDKLELHDSDAEEVTTEEPAVEEPNAALDIAV